MGGVGTVSPGEVYQSEGGANLVMAEWHEPMGDHAKDGGVSGHKPTVHFKVDDVDQFRKSLPQSADVRVEPENTHWGSRWMVIADPDGNLYAYESEPGT